MILEKISDDALMLSIRESLRDYTTHADTSLMKIILNVINYNIWSMHYSCFLELKQVSDNRIEISQGDIEIFAIIEPNVSNLFHFSIMFHSNDNLYLMAIPRIITGTATLCKLRFSSPYCYSRVLEGSMEDILFQICRSICDILVQKDYEISNVLADKYKDADFNRYFYKLSFAERNVELTNMLIKDYEQNMEFHCDQLPSGNPWGNHIINENFILRTAYYDFRWIKTSYENLCNLVEKHQDLKDTGFLLFRKRQQYCIFRDGAKIYAFYSEQTNFNNAKTQRALRRYIKTSLMDRANEIFDGLVYQFSKEFGITPPSTMPCEYRNGSYDAFFSRNPDLIYFHPICFVDYSPLALKMLFAHEVSHRYSNGHGKDFFEALSSLVGMDGASYEKARNEVRLYYKDKCSIDFNCFLNHNCG